MVETVVCKDKQKNQTGQSFETRNIIKLLPTPTPLELLTLKQKKSMFLKAAYTALNYLGYPTESCETDYLEMFKFIGRLFPDNQSMDKRSIYQKAKSLPAPDFFLIVEVVEAVLRYDILFKEKDSIYCKVGTSSSDLQISEEIDASHILRWNEEFYIKIDEKNTNVIIEIWSKSPKGKHRYIGTAVLGSQHVSSTGDRIYLSIVRHSKKNTVRQGYIALCCFYDVIQVQLKVNLIYQHIIFCYLCYEYSLKNKEVRVAKQSFSNDTDEESVGLYEYGLKKTLPSEVVTFLHQHALQHGLTPLENLMCCFIVVCQYYLHATKTSLTTVDALLQEITLLGKCPQKALVPELRDTVVTQISASVKKCCQFLCHIFSEPIDQITESLTSVTQYIRLVQEYYLENAIEKVIANIQAATDFLPPDSLILLDVICKISEEAFGDFVKKLRDVLHILKSADLVFLKEWEVSYSGIMYKRIDEIVMEFFSPAIKIASEGLNNLSFEEIRQFLEIYIFLDDLILYFSNQLPSPEVLSPLEILKCHQLLASEVFIAYAQSLSNQYESSLISWVEKDNYESDERPFDEYISTLLKQWKINRQHSVTQATDALIQICAKFYQRLEQCLKEKYFIGFDEDCEFKEKYDVAVELSVCICINKMYDIINCIHAMCEEVRAMLKERKISDFEGKLVDLSSKYCILLNMFYSSIRKWVDENVQSCLMTLVKCERKDYDEANEKLTSYLEQILNTVKNAMCTQAKKDVFKIVALLLKEAQKLLEGVDNQVEILECLQLYEIIFDKNAT